MVRVEDVLVAAMLRCEDSGNPLPSSELPRDEAWAFVVLAL